MNSLTNKHHVVISDNNTAFTNQSFIESPTNLPNLTKSPCHHSHTVMEFYHFKNRLFSVHEMYSFFEAIVIHAGFLLKDNECPQNITGHVLKKVDQLKIKFFLE